MSLQNSSIVGHHAHFRTAETGNTKNNTRYILIFGILLGFGAFYHLQSTIYEHWWAVSLLVGYVWMLLSLEGDSIADWLLAFFMSGAITVGCVLQTGTWKSVWVVIPLLASSRGGYLCGQWIKGLVAQDPDVERHRPSMGD